MWKFSKLLTDPSAYIFSYGRRSRLNRTKVYCSIWHRILWRLKKIDIGNGLTVYGKTYIYRYPNSQITISDHCEFRSDKTSNLIGIKRNSIISTLAENATINIGAYSGFSGVSIGAANKIIIGSYVMVGANCLITDTNWHNLGPKMRHLSDANPGEVHIGNNVFIGYNCIVLKNVTIGDNTVIGAGSVVTKPIPANVIAAGNPCRIIKSL